MIIFWPPGLTNNFCLNLPLAKFIGSPSTVICTTSLSSKTDPFTSTKRSVPASRELGTSITGAITSFDTFTFFIILLRSSTYF